MGRYFKVGKLNIYASYQRSVFSTQVGSLTYRCNICGETCQAKVDDLGRETPSCPACGSTVRMRAIIHLLSTALFGESLALPDFPTRPEIRGVGLSDWKGYANPLAQKLNYTNTFYHQEPKLDIANIASTLAGALDFLIATDVLEHVAPPVSVCFENMYRLLKPGGVVIFSVPYTKEGQTQEHFPELRNYQLIKQNEHYILKNITQDGREQLFENLVFHGGEGATLEMRYFSKPSLLNEFAQAGFQTPQILHRPYFDYGIYWLKDDSLPMVVKKPGYT
jgi:SAM-dependent methyltransferase